MTEQEEKRALKGLYRRIEAAGPVPCIEGCHDCCGPVGFTAFELKRAPLLEGSLSGFIDSLLANPSAAGLMGCATCPYVTAEGKCGIYQARPFICRLFAATQDPRLACPHGRSAPRPLSREATRTLCAQYKALAPMLSPISEVLEKVLNALEPLANA